MPLHDLMCQDCHLVEANVYVPMDDVMGFAKTCQCGGQMDFDLRRKGKRTTRGIKFKEFTLEHTRRLDGSPEGREIHSLADIRAFEKEHQDQNVCVEAFSYDTEQHIPDPVSADEPTHITPEQREKFLEKYRAMDIKSEETARKDY